MNQQNSAKKILVVGPAWVGDMVMAQSLFISLKKQNSDNRIDVLAPEWSIPLLERMPEVDDAICLRIQHGKLDLNLRYQTAKQLRNNHYDQAIITPRSFKSSLVPFFAGIQQRTAYLGEMRFIMINDVRELNKNILEQTVQRYVALAEKERAPLRVPKIHYPHLLSYDDNTKKLLGDLQLKTNKPIIGFCAGAEYGPAKQWPLQYYQQLAEKLIAQGKQVWVFGSNKDFHDANKISAGNSDAIINLCGKTSLQDVIDLMPLCEQVVCNDSGLMHIAAACGVKILAIYGSSSPEYTPPLSDTAKIFYQQLDCSPCFQRECPLGHGNCLKSIAVDDVLQCIN